MILFSCIFKLITAGKLLTENKEEPVNILEHYDPNDNNLEHYDPTNEGKYLGRGRTNFN
ncbi:hypothetical protein HERIO_2770 [Hepatospora eriocheir]|uniref:Uncharacterized protein n=1 Tax=Hepatospora eriocheir TaxID=1081669 RepID=A0A1X0Q9M4_9MICR|nr:hypothetical protein HERIO_2770 [Hepatospora eriocheir]